MNVFQANYFVGLGLLSLSAMVVLLFKDLDDIGKICPKEFLRYFLKISNIYDVVILQLDRLVAVRYPYYYNEKMDVSISFKIVGISKIFSVAITVIASIIDPVFVYCPACGRCLFVRSINVYTVCYPGLAAFILTLAVSTYITKIVYTVNSVQPVVQLPIIGRTVNVVPANLERDAAGNEEQNDHIEQEETESLEEIKIENLLREIRRQERSSRILTSVDGASTSKAFSKPNTATQDSFPSDPSPLNNTVETPKKEILKNTLKMNLLTLALLFILVPTQVIIIIYENCNDGAGECDFFFKFMQVTPLIQLVSAIIHPLVVLLVL